MGSLCCDVYTELELFTPWFGEEGGGVAELLLFPSEWGWIHVSWETK